MDAKQTRIAIEKAIDWMVRHVRESEPTVDDAVGTSLLWVLLDAHCMETGNAELIHHDDPEDIANGYAAPSAADTLKNLTHGLAYGFIPLDKAMDSIERSLIERKGSK